jgi:hypothetical protein
MSHSDEQLVRGTMLRFGSLDFVFNGPVECLAGAMFKHSQPNAPVPLQVEQPEEPRSTKSAADRVWNLVGHDMAAGLGLNLSQELFRFVVYATSILVFGVQGEEALSWDEFKLCYDFMYPEEQTWLPCGGTGALATMEDYRPVSSEGSQASYEEVDSGTPLRKGALTPHDPTHKCFVLQQHADVVHSAYTDESSAEGELQDLAHQGAPTRARQPWSWRPGLTDRRGCSRWVDGGGRSRAEHRTR